LSQARLRFAILASLILLSAACIFSVPVQPVQVRGTAMVPALNEGDRIVIERNPQKLERGDIIVFLFPEDQTVSYIKRIVGLTNETVQSS
jgi:signal peptidase I